MSEKKTDKPTDAFERFCKSTDIFDIGAAFAEMEKEIVQARERTKKKADTRVDD